MFRDLKAGPAGKETQKRYNHVDVVVRAPTLCRNFMLSSATPSFACGCSLKTKKKEKARRREKLCENRESREEVGGGECDILTITSVCLRILDELG